MQENFGKISEIDPQNLETWSGRTFLTFDTDWACNEILEDSFEITKESGVPSTWFCTNKNGIEKALRDQTEVEIGIHPNFNYLINPLELTRASSSLEALKALIESFPEATAVRSHSLFNSERLIDQFLTFGLTHSCNSFLPTSSQIQAKPWNLWGGSVCVPHNWQDNVSLKMELPLKSQADPGEINVVNFHPIHIFLNTSDLETYEATRDLHAKPKELIRYRKAGFGIRDIFLKFLEVARASQALN